MRLGIGVPDKGYRLEGKIRNKGIMLVTHNLHLAEGSEISNETVFFQVARLIIFGESAILLDAAAKSGSILIGPGTALQQEGNGSSEMFIPVSITKGEILVNGVGGTLIFRRSADFYEASSKVFVSESGQLEFRIKAGEKLTMHGDLTFTGMGTAKVIDSDVLIKALFHVAGGHIPPNADSNVRIETTDSWVIDGGTTTIEDTGGIVIGTPGGEVGVLKWKRGIIDGGAISNKAEIFNNGILDISGTGLHKLIGSITNNRQLTIESSVSGEGIIFNSDGGIVFLKNNNDPIDIGVNFANTSKVIATIGTTATFSKLVEQLKDGTLNGGEWIVNDKAVLTLAPRSGNQKITVIRDKAQVELRGSGNLNGLNNVVGDLDIRNRGKLYYRDVKSANVSGQLNIFAAGELRMFGSKLTVTGDLEMGSNLADLFGLSSSSTLVLDVSSKLIVNEQFEVLSGAIVNLDGTLQAGSVDIENGGSFAGSGRIQTVVDGTSGVFRFTNSGKLIPGNSPGILTIDGDYTQTETGVLEIEVGGAVPGDEHDQLVVNGNAALGGTLLLYTIDGYEWTNTVPVSVIQATTYQGMFDQIIVGGGTSRRTANVEIVGEMLTVATNTITVTNFGDWRSAHFNEADLADEAISGQLADPDSDGSANLLEYAFDGVPNYKDAQTVLSEIRLNEAGDEYRVKVRFPWAHGMTDVEYTMQTSPNLGIWTDLESTLTSTEPGDFTDLLTVEAEIGSAGNIPIYGRLLVREIGL